MKLKKTTKIFTSMLLIISMLITLLPGNSVFGEESIDYTAPTVTSISPNHPSGLNIEISFPVEQNQYMGRLYVRAYYEYVVNGSVYRVDKYEASTSAYDDEMGVYEGLYIQLAPNMGGLYDVYVVAGAIYSDGTVMECEPVKVPMDSLPKHYESLSSYVASPIEVEVPAGTDSSGNIIYNNLQYGYNYDHVMGTPDYESETASISYQGNVLTLSGYFGDINLRQLRNGYDVTKLVLDNAHFQKLSTSRHKPLNIELIGDNSGIIWFDYGTDILMTAAPGQTEKPSFNGPIISHGASTTDLSVAILSNIRYTAHSDDSLPNSWYRTIGFSAAVFDNCDVEITNTNTSYTAIATSDLTLASAGSLYTRINGSSLIVKDSNFCINSDANAINIGNNYPVGMANIATADVVFDNSQAEILLGLTNKNAYTTGINGCYADSVLDVKNGSSLKVRSEMTGGYTAISSFKNIHVDKTSQLLIDFKNPYNENLSGRYLAGISSTIQNSLIDIEGSLDISTENGYDNLTTNQRGINCNGSINFHNNANVNIRMAGGKSLQGINSYGTGLNIDNADIDIGIFSNPESTSYSYGIYAQKTNTLSNANVKIDTQGGRCYNFYAPVLSINDTNLEIGMHRALDTITNYTYFNPFYINSSGAEMTGNNTLTVRVPGECYNNTKSKMDTYFPGADYDLKQCICEPGSINSQCMIYKAGDINSDGIINNIDSTMLLRYVSNISSLTSSQTIIGDLNNDLTVDLRDVIELLNIVEIIN